MYLPISYLINVNRAKITAILDLLFGQIADNTKEIASDSNSKINVTRIGWLSCVRTGKLYKSMVLCPAAKKDADLLIARGFIEVEDETAYMKKF